MTRPRSRRIYLCGGEPLCRPCRTEQHADCSWDGEPDCLCPDCPPERKAANRAALDAALPSTVIRIGASQ